MSINRRRLLTSALALAGPPALGVTSAATAAAHPDAVLIAAERQIAVLRAELFDDPDDDAYDPVWELEDVIACTPAATLIGAAVKLRRLLDPDLGLETGAKEHDVESLQHVLDVVERELGRTAAA
jgi:hypothetical protein